LYNNNTHYKSMHTGTSQAALDVIVKDLVRTHEGEAAESLKVSAVIDGTGGVRHVRMAQEINGLRVYGSYVKAAVDSQGQLQQVIEKVAKPGAVSPATVTDSDALSSAMTELGYDFATPALASKNGSTSTFENAGEFHLAPSVERVIFADDTGALHEGFEVQTWSQKGNQLNYTLVDGKGAVVKTELRTNNDRYNVFTVDPGKTAQAVVTGPAGTTASPNGWLGTGAQNSVNITGNNAHAYLDTDANNSPDTGGTAVTTGDFLTSADLNASPSTAGNKNVAVQNLFYFNNTVHDVLYSHGFTEAAGNFQTDNFGRGGAANDPVLAEAQDGSGTDNANFSAPNDGSSGRMQMYLWSGAGPDSSVIVSGTAYGAWAAGFGPALTPKTAALAVYNDGVGDTDDGCEASTTSLSGKIALVQRGTCDFITKVLNAQSAGAVAVVIFNNDGSKPFAMGGTSRKVKVPSVMVSDVDGATLEAKAGQSATVQKNATPPLQADGDVDSDIVFHEYGHGLTWRMVGGMSGALAGAIGEGASDTVAFLINGNDPNADIVGEYAYGDPNGIRRHRYAGYETFKTYSGVTGAEVHDDGEIFAAAMWAVFTNYKAAGYTKDDCLEDFVQGLNYPPSTPTYENMRDGMVSAVKGTAKECLVWRGFAKLGIGVGSSGTVSKRGVVTITQSFATPAGCGAP
ncbi:MAG: M36 family metallopeptidase, partial [Myxococcaceae bacterium]